MFENMNVVRKNTEAVLVATEAASLEINTDKIEYIFMPLEQNVRYHCKVNIINKSIKYGLFQAFWNDMNT
jgi:hypothetical protein